jgi:hypothetical protein
MFMFEILEAPIEIFYGIVSTLRCRCRSLKNKWERDEVVERASKQIEKDLDVIELVKI